MYEPRILLKGPFVLDAFELAPVDRHWSANPAYDAAVAEHWERRVQDAAARGHHLWDGTHYRLDDLSDLAAGGTLRLGTVAFRHIATFRMLHEMHRAQGLEPFHHVSTAALLGTADGFYVFGKRAINGAIDFIGGGFQPEGGAPDFAANMLKEIREETGIAPDQLGAMTGLGVVRSSTSNILVMAGLSTALTCDGVLEAFARREDDEMAEPVFVPAGDVVAYLRAMTDYRALVADLL
jgi:8-oxo-dGTP pyrophosphatase MutT (NUDIX family)